MQILIVLALVAAAAVAAPQYEPIFTDYHKEIGIPEAARIKALEESMDFDGSRIAGGVASNHGQHPFFAGLLVLLTVGTTSICGSTVLSNTRVLTAAHCWRQHEHRGRQVTVVLGTTRLYSGGVRVVSNRVTLHNNYNEVILANDIAIIIINHVGFNNVINRATLPAGNQSYLGVHGTAVGFGRTADGPAGNINNAQALRHVSLQVISNDDCRRLFGNIFTVNNICTSGAGGRSICGGDSGGPLMVGGSVIGVVSFGAPQGCQRGFPAAFSRVTSYAAWIRGRM